MGGGRRCDGGRDGYGCGVSTSISFLDGRFFFITDLGHALQDWKHCSMPWYLQLGIQVDGFQFCQVCISLESRRDRGSESWRV